MHNVCCQTEVQAGTTWDAGASTLQTLTVGGWTHITQSQGVLVPSLVEYLTPQHHASDFQLPAMATSS